MYHTLNIVRVLANAGFIDDHKIAFDRLSFTLSISNLIWAVAFIQWYKQVLSKHKLQ